ncbi:MAG: glycosyltransferase [bacterium]
MKPTPFFFSRLDQRVYDIIKSFQPNVIFIPTARFWKLDRIPCVNMIRNMEPLIYTNQNPFSERFINWIRYKEAYRCTINADRVIATSDFVKSFLINKWNIDYKKIGLVYHGIKIPEHTDLQRPCQVPEDWKGKFIFTAGSIRPARGIEDVFFALKCLKNFSQIAGLVLAGTVPPRMHSYRKKLEKWIDENNLSSIIRWTNNLHQDEMAWCYKNCFVFIMTSRVEACPNIALEAMSYGCVSIVTDNKPMPEIFGDTARYYSAKDGDGLARSIQTILDWNVQLRNEASEKAKKRASEFSWDICANETIAELDTVV